MDRTFTLEELMKEGQAYYYHPLTTRLHSEDLATLGRLRPLLELDEKRRLEEERRKRKEPEVIRETERRRIEEKKRRKPAKKLSRKKIIPPKTRKTSPAKPKKTARKKTKDIKPKTSPVSVSRILKEKWMVSLAKAQVTKKDCVMTIGGQKYDMFHAQMGFTARPPRQFLIKNVMVDVVFDKECVQTSDATNIGMAPMDIVDKTKIIRKRGIKPKIGVDIADKVSVEGELFEYTQSEEIETTYPRVVQFYKGQSQAAWEFSSTPVTRQVIGDMALELLVRQRPDCTTQATMEVSSIIENRYMRDRFMRIILRKGPITDWDELSFSIG